MTHTKHRKRRERYAQEIAAPNPIYDRLMMTYPVLADVTSGRTGRAG